MKSTIAVSSFTRYPAFIFTVSRDLRFPTEYLRQFVALAHGPARYNNNITPQAHIAIQV